VTAVVLANELLMAGLELSQVLERALRDRVELSLNQFNVLRVVAGRETRTAHAVDLIRVLGMSSAHATTVIQQLEQRGLVKRRESTADRRRRAVTLTDSGTEVLRRALPLLAELGEQVATALEAPGAAADLHAKLRRIRLTLRHGPTAREWDDCLGP
jgi:DNA-binding MarR family transcriptional regulator